MGVLDILFPKYCVSCGRFGTYVCDMCFARISFCETGSCVICQKAAIGGITHPGCRGRFVIDGVFASLTYASVVKKLVYRFKYKPFLTDLEATLSDFFYEGLIQKELFCQLVQQEIVFMPIPLHATRLRRRGYNQAELLAKRLSERFNQHNMNCLERVKNTNRQWGLTQKEREENIKDAFLIKASCLTLLSEQQTVCLVDDVVTSGATMKEAARVLKKAGVKKVWGVALAHGS